MEKLQLQIKNLRNVSVDIRKIIYEQLEESNNVPFTQAPWYADWHESLLRKTEQIAITDQSNRLYGYIQLIECRLPFNFSFYYSPYGPVILDRAEEVIIALKPWLKKFQKETNSIFIRLDITPKNHEIILKKYFKKVPDCAKKGSIIQPRVEWQIDLTKNREELLSEMNKKTRYDIRQSEGKGVSTLIGKRETRALNKTFYKMMKETSIRNNFHLHPEEYYKTVFETIDREDTGYVIVGMSGENLISMHVIVIYGDTAMYAFGATTDEHRSIPSSHVLQWNSILYAKEKGLKYYNMGGVTSELYPDSSLEDVTRFKKRFGGYEYVHAELYDQINRPVWYYIFIFRKLILSVFKK